MEWLLKFSFLKKVTARALPWPKIY
jgi:hypothetical protein